MSVEEILAIPTTPSVATCLLQLMARTCVDKSFHHKHMSRRHMALETCPMSLEKL